MATLAFPLPVLSEADPVIAGEGSLDPLGLAQVADRLADHLLPGIRARMRRIRFLTASAVGALAAEDLFEVAPTDGVSSPSICFEWLVLEAFARRTGQGGPLEASGVPGSSKVRTVIAQGKRLTARNYLKSPNVFGFTGVYLPLARHLEILDDARRPAANITMLTRAWEMDQRLDGFTDATQGTAGGQLRARLRGQILESLRVGHCAENESGHLWKRLCDHLHPTQPGALERGMLTAWLADEGEPVRSWLAPRLAAMPDASERSAVTLLLGASPPNTVRVRLEAIEAYERVASLLESAFRQIRHRSTLAGTIPVTPASSATDDVISSVAKSLPIALRDACDKIERIDGELSLMVGARLAAFESTLSPAAFVESLMAHHEVVQAGKAPRGKRPWFDRFGSGWVVRSLYRYPDEVAAAGEWYVHPYRLAALQTFMKDLDA